MAKNEYGSTSARPRKLTPFAPHNEFSLGERSKCLAACYFVSVERGFPPTVDDSCDISGCDYYLWRHNHYAHKGILVAALLALLVSSVLEGSKDMMLTTMFLTTCAGGVFVLDLALIRQYQLRFETKQWLALAIVLTHVAESIISTNDYVWSSVWSKPFLLCYVFPTSTSTALATLLKIVRTCVKVFGAELLLISCFSAIGHELYGSIDAGFSSFFHSFVTMFALSTSVNNPSSWLALYKQNRLNSLFFIAFLILSLFYVHCLVLGLVVKAYSMKRKDALEESTKAKAVASDLAFKCLQRDPGNEAFCRKADLRAALGYLRPHYGSEKLDRLVKGAPENLDRTAFGVVTAKAVRTSIRRGKKRHFRRSLGYHGWLRASLISLKGVSGPVILTFSALHMLVYLGIALWGGKVGPR